MRSFATWLFLASTLAIGSAAASGSESPNVTAIDLDVTFTPEERSMAGTAVLHFEPTSPGASTVELLLHGELSVESVMVGTSPVQFEQEPMLYPLDYSLVATRVTVQLGGADLGKGMTVVYGGEFNRSRARSPSDYMRIDGDGVLLRAYRYSPWFPIVPDDGRSPRAVDFNDVVLRTPADFVTVFTGTHLGDRVTDGVRVSRWTAPATELFAAQCTARRFDVTVQGSLRLYSERDDASRAATAEIARVVARLDEIYRRDYRRDAVAGQLHVMEMPRYGEISSGNVVGLTSEDWVDFATSFDRRRTLAHELVHSFVQLKTARDDLLVAMAVEGFPAYMHLPALAELDGDAGYRATMARCEEAYLRRRETGTDRRGRPLPPEKPIVAIGFDEIGEYKDGLVLGDRALLFQSWLRSRMGTDRFRSFTRELFAPHDGSYVAFRALLQRYLPDEREDIDLWLETTEYPPRLRLPASAP